MFGKRVPSHTLGAMATLQVLIECREDKDWGLSFQERVSHTCRLRFG